MLLVLCPLIVIPLMSNKFLIFSLYRDKRPATSNIPVVYLSYLADTILIPVSKSESDCVFFKIWNNVPYCSVCIGRLVNIKVPKILVLELYIYFAVNDRLALPFQILISRCAPLSLPVLIPRYLYYSANGSGDSTSAIPLPCACFTLITLVPPKLFPTPGPSHAFLDLVVVTLDEVY